MEKNPSTFVDTLKNSDRPTSKTKVMIAALHLFANNGFHATTTAQIAKKAGVSEGTIYKYFDSKEDLLRNILTPGIIELCKGFFIEFDRYDTLDELVDFIIKDRLTFAENNFELVKLLFQELLLNPFDLSLSQEELINPELIIMSVNALQSKYAEVNQSLSAIQIIRIFAGPLTSYTLQDKVFSKSIDARFDSQSTDFNLIHQQIIAGLTAK